MGPTDLRVFLDLDGVVADWLGKAVKTFGLNTKSEVVKKVLSENARGIEQLIDLDFMWRAIDGGGAAWWNDIEPFPWAGYLYRELSAIGETIILSQPSQHGSSADGKTQWIQKVFGRHAESLLGGSKHACGQKYSVLIDDTPKKIDKFEKAGGKGVLFPNAHRLQILYPEAFTEDFDPEKDWRDVKGLKSIIDGVIEQVRMYKAEVSQ